MMQTVKMNGKDRQTPMGDLVTRELARMSKQLAKGKDRIESLANPLKASLAVPGGGGHQWRLTLAYKVRCSDGEVLVFAFWTNTVNADEGEIRIWTADEYGISTKGEN